MVQQNYIHRLGLGRSAFEAPSEQALAAAAEVQEAQAVNSNIQFLQRYDDRGHPVNPESRAASRRLRRAQNDVLSTIGITLPTQARPGPLTVEAEEAARKQRVLKDREGWASIGVFWLNDVLLSATATAFHNRRVQIATLSICAGVPLSAIYAVELKRFGFISTCFAGIPMYWAATQLAEILAGVTRLSVPALLDEGWILCFGPEYLEEQRNAALRQLERAIDVAATLAIQPLHVIMILQRLQLVPAVPLLVWPWQFSMTLALRTLLPPFPNAWCISTAIQFTGALLWSPVGIFFLSDFLRRELHLALSRYVRAILPRPDNPSNRKPTPGVAANEEWPITDYPRLQPTLKEVFAIDLRWIAKKTTIYWFWMRDFFAPADVTRHRQRMIATFNLSRTEPEPGAEIELEATPINHDRAMMIFREIEAVLLDFDWEDFDDPECQSRTSQILLLMDALHTAAVHDAHIMALYDDAKELIRQHTHDRHPTHGETQSGTARRNSVLSEAAGTQELPPEDDPANSTNESAGGPLSSHPPANAPAPSLASSSPRSSPVLEPSNVQVRARSGSTSTLHMDVEINQAAIDGSTITTSFSASPRTAEVATSMSQVIAYDGRNTMHHRVTELTLQPADLLSQAILRLVVQGLLLPLQSYQYRSIARRFLGATDPRRVGDVYSPSGWFGLGIRAGGRRNAMEYSAKLALLLGAEALINIGVWMVVAPISPWMGKKWFQWDQA